ncbi:3-oxoacyl-ACP reductase FabG [Lactococcus allomyrinae]|uniref:SDR family oxidoreductase n=1 Tax=Lactococcus allomyrinae TaxID=2419773 RepID=A0A387BLI3_9LACT|nr:3-oxoacyl-ACP reductase FabG [Lactococcus allomyrinae]AYG02059.1 SDR family oxidoreductase [Lactococcus allomyrinae]
MKIVIVTGGTRGIGRAISLEFFKEGYKVIAIYQGNERAAQDLKEEFPNIEIEKCDISDEKEVSILVNKIYKRHGKIDCLVNNAGITRDGYFLMMSNEKWNSLLNVNLTGTFNVSRAVLRFMKVKKLGGKIINISSTSGVAGQIGQTNYAASKGAIISLTKSLAKEFASDKINVNCVSPGFIETDMTASLKNKEMISETLIPLQRFGQVEEVAYLVTFLASEKANYITGKNFVIDGGMIND